MSLRYLSSLFFFFLLSICEITLPLRSTPRGKWLYALCGIGTIFSSFLGAGPLLISPESAPGEFGALLEYEVHMCLKFIRYDAGLKAGAKTGLSVVVCGLLFIASVAIGPILASAPVAGTSPVLLMIGVYDY